MRRVGRRTQLLALGLGEQCRGVRSKERGETLCSRFSGPATKRRLDPRASYRAHDLEGLGEMASLAEMGGEAPRFSSPDTPSVSARPIVLRGHGLARRAFAGHRNREDA